MVPTLKTIYLFFLITSIACLAQDSTVQQTFQQATEAMRAGQFDSAAEQFSAVIARAPNFAEAHLNLGLVREEQKQFPEAIASLKKALVLKPGLRGANLFLGLAEYRLNDFQNAIAHIRKETKLNPADANAWMWLGVAQLAANQPAEAAESLDRAAKLAPGNVDVLYHQGRAHMLVSKQSYEKMFKANPDSWRVRQVLAQADAEADRHEGAIAEYNAAIKLAHAELGLHEELGTEYWKIGQFDAAEAEYHRELELDPNNILASYKLGCLRVERGNASEGKGLIAEALKKDSNLKDAHYYLGKAEMQLGNNEGAISHFRQAITGDSNPEIIRQAYYQLAQLYRRMHRTEDAQAALAQFQKLKEEADESQHELLEKKRQRQEQNAADQPVPADNHD